MNFKITFNAPVTLGFILLAFIIQCLALFYPPILDYFSIGGSISLSTPFDFVRLFTHVLGHADFSHLFSNSILLLLLGPILEEKYGGKKLIMVILMTGLVTALVNVALFSTGLMGASGVVFAFIVLASVVNVKSGTLPLTFILVFGLYVGKEIVGAFNDDQISQMAHIVGGFVGAAFGFWLKR